jgi:hypothetical protein
LEIDGQIFPWFVRPGFRIAVDRTDAPSVRVDILAERLEVTDDMEWPPVGVVDEDVRIDQSAYLDGASSHITHLLTELTDKRRIDGLIAEINRRGARIAELQREANWEIRPALLEDAAYWLGGIGERGFAGVAHGDDSSLREVRFIIGELKRVAAGMRGRAPHGAEESPEI